MPSSITLTVSNLPTSTSFFLSALQPLDYVYRGRCDNTIGFGSATSPSAPADFWITQEVPGVPAGAAHVAFNAPSRLAVQHFFTAALKAGGKFHGDPAIRDGSGYYSAAVIDFDGNSIEAVYRPTFSDDKENDVKSVVSNAKSTATARSAAKTSVSRAAPMEAKSSFSRPAPTVVQSTTSRAPPPPPLQASSSGSSKPSGDIIESLMTEARNAANVAREIVERARPSMNTTSGASGGGSGETIIGTLLGVAAGAALHYAFTNYSSNDNDQHRPAAFARSATEPAPTQYHNYRAIGAAPSYYEPSPRSITLEDNEYASTVRPAKSYHTRRNSGSIISTGSGSDHRSRSSREGDIKMIEGGSSTSKSSRRSGVRMIEAPPPPSASTHISTSSSRHNGSISDPLPAVANYARSHLSDVKSHHSSTTVIRTTEEVVQRVSSQPSPSTASKSRAPLSRAPTVLREPEEYPLPPSRAGTWAGESMASKAKSRSGESMASKAKSRSGESTASKAKSRSGESRHSKTSKSSSKSKAKESVFDQEVTPDDSISQISVKSGTTVKG